MKKIFFLIMSLLFASNTLFAMSQDELNCGLRNSAAKRMPKAVKYFLRLGADPNSPDKYGSTALHYAASFNYMGMPLFGSEYIIEILLRSHANPNAQNMLGNTPINMNTCDDDLVIPSNLHLIKLLLAGGANPYIKNKKGLSIFSRLDSINEKFNGTCNEILHLIAYIQY